MMSSPGGQRPQDITVLGSGLAVARPYKWASVMGVDHTVTVERTV